MFRALCGFPVQKYGENQNQIKFSEPQTNFFIKKKKEFFPNFFSPKLWPIWTFNWYSATQKFTKTTVYFPK